MAAMRSCSLFCATLVALSGCSLVVPSPDDYTYGDSDAGLDGGGAVGDSGPDAGAPDAGFDSGVPDFCMSIEHECDLVISCSMPDPVVGAGDTITVPWQASNLGGLTRTSSFRVVVRMDRAGTLTEVGDERFAGFIEPLGTAMGTVSFPAPDWVVNGAQDLECVIDSDSEIPETDESNNTDSTTVTASGLPDLAVAAIGIPTMPPGGMGEQFMMTFDIVNSGPVAVRDAAWIVTGSVSGGGGTLASGMESEVAAGAAATVPNTVTVPFNFNGPGTVTIRVDPGLAVAESDESNNEVMRSVDWQR